ncbi:MAG: sigma-54-dependent Fis family transcriptional regulator [Phycisphaerae bacterium]|nr:sigma-54-dependent Fis family transcriptional regulator [Phycisphaerae bacterium]
MGHGKRNRVLVVDDDAFVAEALCEFLAGEGYDAQRASSGAEALGLLSHAERDGSGPGGFAACICDLTMPGMDGVEVLRRIGKEHPGVAVVMLTGYGTIESAVSAVRAGAVDYLTKPVVDAELRLALERALRQHALAGENLRLRSQLEERFGLDSIVGSDARMMRVFDLIEAVAPSRTTVLMSGESGTGKSLIAHAIHRRGPRRDGPFVEISCGSIPETLLESELFGHVKGAFTGAHADKVGRFLAANGGTIFLDEINSASPGMQLKLLRVLQERRFEPVGSTQTVEVDVRVVLASNQPLEKLVARGQFRQDLFYRINVVMIELPPLRERPADIPMLAARFLGRYAAELKKQIVGFSPEALEALTRYTYPGNVRELQNAVERAAVLCRGQVIQACDLPPQLLGGAPAPGPADAEGGEWSPMTLDEALREPEKRILLRALRANAWSRQRTADQLGINRTTLYKKMKAHGLDRPDEREAG